MPWVATSVRMAQNLGLDTLWESPESMPIPDPALPEGTSLLARQIGGFVAAELFNHADNSFVRRPPLVVCSVPRSHALR